MHHSNYKDWLGGALRWAALLALLLALGGCLHLADPQPRALQVGPFMASPAGSSPEGQGPRLSWRAAALAVALGLGWLAWALGRGWLRKTPQVEVELLDREDVALLRTARDALGYFARKHLGRMKVVSLTAWRRLHSSSKSD